MEPTLSTGSPADSVDRRSFFSTMAAISAAAAAGPIASASLEPGQASGAGAAPSGEGAPVAEITPATIAAAEQLAGISFTAAEREQMLRSIGDQVEGFRARAAFGPLENGLAPASVFHTLLPGESPLARVSSNRGNFLRRAPEPPADDSALDWATVVELGAWIRGGHLTSRRLVERSLTRLRAVDPTLHCVITLCEEQALAEADRLDAELRAGRIRGALHGIPYGLKDLFDTAGIRTTWGATPWQARIPGTDAVIVERLRDAGAVLVGKLALGALAYGDIWFGGTCRNPWNPEQGSSGSSAGSAAAVAAGCVPFAIGTETLGSIVSPSVRCGTTGLRPTFGRVSREGAMALCWSWDKIGPITRSVIDTGLVLAAMNGRSMGDPSSIDVAFHAPTIASARERVLAYDPRWFEGRSASLRGVLEAAERAGVVIVERPVELPGDPGALLVSLMSEAAAAFEEMTRSGADDSLVWQADEAWPNSFRQTWFVPAIELVQAERLRRNFMQAMRPALDGVDGLILPPFAGGMLVVTNATGHPQLVMRAAAAETGTQSISLIGHPFDEATLIEIGAAIEAELGVASVRPPMAWLDAE